MQRHGLKHDALADLELAEAQLNVLTDGRPSVLYGNLEFLASLWQKLGYEERAKPLLDRAAVIKSQSTSNPRQTLISKDPVFGPYLVDLQRRIKRSWFPPRGHESDTVSVTFQVDRMGRLIALGLVTESGHLPSDLAALKAIENAPPFRPLPEVAREVQSFDLTFGSDLYSGGRLVIEKSRSKNR
jgi:TonB family protein